MDYILSQFEKFKAEYKDDMIFSSMFNSGWAKMNKYYELSDDTPVYVAALVLYPSRKWRYIEKHWEKDWVITAKERMKAFWQTKYKPDSTASSSTTDPPPPPTNTRPLNEFFQWLDDDASEAITDEYDQYCDLPQIPGIKQGYTWWLEPTQQTRFPNLSRMALDILSIPAMSADPERLFSGAKITISDRRNRLGIATIQALECLKSWLKLVEISEEDIRDEDDDIGGSNSPGDTNQGGNS